MYSEKICSSATLSTTNPTLPDLGLNPDCSGGKPATNRLSYGTTRFCRLGRIHFDNKVIHTTKAFPLLFNIPVNITLREFETHFV
jgi:hypothetical protein